MDEARLLEGVLRGVLGGRRKRGRRTLQYLTGGSGGSLLRNPQVLMTAAGLAWGLIESLSTHAHSPSAATGPVTPPVPLPLPSISSEGAPGTAAPRPPSGDVLRLVRLAISAAHADGAMNDVERAAVEHAAAQHGAGEALAAELAQPLPLATIVAGVESPVERATLYGLAFAVARADEQVGGAERIYLAQLAHLLGLDAATVGRIEAAASTRIDSTTGDAA